MKSQEEIAMSTDVEAIFTAAVSLNDSERLDLAARLLDTISDNSGGISLDDPGLVEELQRRNADIAGATAWSQLRSLLQ